jgi:hypothetical protein
MQNCVFVELAASLLTMLRGPTNRTIGAQIQPRLSP